MQTSDAERHLAPAGSEAPASVPRSILHQGVPAKKDAPISALPAASHDGSATLYAVQSLAYIVVVAIFTIAFSLQPFRIPSASMEPALLVGDFLLVDKQQPTKTGHLDPLPRSVIHRGDVVVFYYPLDPSMHLVKRVVGLPGDRLHMRDGHVFINGNLLTEPYAVYSPRPQDSYRDNFPHLQTTVPDVDARWWIEMHRLVDHGDLRIPPQQYFVLGDNRNDSEDSRYWGLVPKSAIVGEPFLVYFSLRDRRPTIGSPKWSDVLAGLARWDRTMHIVR